MTKTQTNIIKKLNDGLAMSVTGLASYFGSLPGPIGRCVASLKKTGLVKVDRDGFASLTVKGRKAAEKSN